MIVFDVINGKLVPKSGDPEEIQAFLNEQKEKSGWRGVRNWWRDHSILSRLDKYIIKKFLGTYFFSIALIISIAIVFDFNENIDSLLGNNVPWHAIIFDYYLNFVPYYTNLFSQLFVFISVLFFTTKLADNSEIIAMMSTGVSFNRLMRPYVISAAFIGLMTFGLSCYVIPDGNVRRVKFENTYKKRRADRNVTFVSNVQLEVDSGVIAYISRYEDNQKCGYDFTLDKFENKKLVKHLQAMTIQYDSVATEPNHWIITNYQTRDLQGMREIIANGYRMDTVINMEPQDLLVKEDQEMTMTSPDLHEYIVRQKKRGFANIKTFEVEYWKRGASSFAAFILTIIGASLSARKRKSGMGLTLGVGLALSVTYILFQTIATTFATQGNVPALVAVWIPNIIYAFIALYCYMKAPR